MPRNSYQDRLEQLRGEVGAMGDLTQERYEGAVSVLDSGEAETARRIIEGDEELNEWYLDIEGECIELIALQQPVASDLRFIASSFKIVTDLERIGDLATNLAGYGRAADGEIFDAVDIDQLATTAGEMVEEAMAAYAVDDIDAAREVAAKDDELDEQCRQASEAIVRTLLTADSGIDVEAELENVSRTLLTIRDIERVGDHAVNICARTLYMVDNDDELIY